MTSVDNQQGLPSMQLLRAELKRIALEEEPSAGSGSRWPRMTPIRLGFAVAALALVGVALALVLTPNSPVGGTEQALAIERTPREITLRIADPEASDEEMNAQLAAAGIDRIRVLSVPGQPDDVGAWVGFAEFGYFCDGGTVAWGSYGVDIANRGHLRGGAPSLFDLRVPSAGPSTDGTTPWAVVTSSMDAPSGGNTLTVDTKAAESPRYSAKIVVRARPATPDDGPDANVIDYGTLESLGGAFAKYGEDSQTHATCEDLGLESFKPFR